MYLGYFSYKICSILKNNSVFFIVMGKSIFWSTEITLSESNFSPLGRKYDFNNWISFSNSNILLFKLLFLISFSFIILYFS